MLKSFTTFATGFALLGLCATTSNADGVDPIFDFNGNFIDDIEIIEDVTTQDGRTWAVLEMTSEFMRFYVDPDAIYVMMEDNNPIIRNQTPFDGFWVSTQTPDNANWPICNRDAYDEFGAPYQVHGNLLWTNTGINDNGYELEFYIDLGSCDDEIQEWGLSRAALERIGGGSGNDGTQPPAAPSYTLTDASGVTFNVTVTPDGTTLQSLTPRDITITSNGAVTGVYYETEELVIYANCTAFSPRRGWGEWSWANGGFGIGFQSAGFSFPRMDAPIENGGGCRS